MKVQYVVIRGPLGCGKSTISLELANKLDAKCFSVDEIMDESPEMVTMEEGYISRETFKKVNDILVSEARGVINSGQLVIFDGNFYWEEVVEDLLRKLGGYVGKVITLEAPLDVCVERDIERGETHGSDAAEEVYRKSTSFDCGVGIDTKNRSVVETVGEILEVLG